MNYNIEKSKWLMSLPEKYRPNSVQKIVAVSNEDTRNKVYFGDRQSGRTLMLLLDTLYEAINTPIIRICVMASSVNSTRILANKLQEIITDCGLENRVVRIMRNPNKIEFENGTVILFLNRDIDFRGQCIDRLYIDNLETINQYTLEAATARTLIFRDSKIIANCIPNPPEIAARFIEGLLRGN